jgi:hypothetical protein
MGTFDTFRNRVAISGSSEAMAYENNTIKFINNRFPIHPMFMTIPIDGVNTDVRLQRDVDADSPHMKRLTFRPNTTTYEGSIVQLYSKNWIIDKYDPHPYFPTGHIMECGEMLTWMLQDGTTKKSYPCSIFPDSRTAMWHQDNFMQEVTYQTKVYVPYNADTVAIGAGLRVIFGNSNQVFELVGIDSMSKVFDGHGIIVFSPQLVTSNSKDDFVNRIADNTQYYSKQQKTQGGGFSW